jgi:uncharacterized membrane protein
MEEEIHLLDTLVAREVLAPSDEAPAREWLLAPPARGEWATFLHIAGLGFGTAAALAGVLYLVAFNWSDLGIVSRLGAVYAALLAAGTVSIVLGPRTLGGQLGALAAAVLAGAGLVVYSQVYQSGANPWVLFAAWSALALPFVLAARTPPLWALLVVLVDLTVATGVASVVKFEWVEPITFVVAGVALAHLGAAELARGTWLQGVLRAVAITTLTWLGGFFLVSVEQSDPWGLGGAALAFASAVIWSVGAQVLFAQRRATMGTALVGVIALSALVVTEVSMRMVEGFLDVTFLPIAFTVFGLTAAGYWWLTAGPDAVSGGAE